MTTPIVRCLRWLKKVRIFIGEQIINLGAQIGGEPVQLRIARAKQEAFQIGWAEGPRAERNITAPEHPEWEGKQTVC